MTIILAALIGTDSGAWFLIAGAVIVAIVIALWWRVEVVAERREARRSHTHRRA